MNGTTRSYSNYVLFMVALGQGFSFLDRQIVTILLPSIKADLLVTDTQLGLLSGAAFAVVYAAFGLPLAYLADRVSRKTLMAASVVVWSAMTTLSGVTQSFGQLMLSRVGVGIGEAGFTPAAYSLISDYFGRARRQTALAIINVGPHLGIVLGLVIGGLVAPVFGWRAAFLIAGGPGLIYGIVLFLTVREPVRGSMDDARSAPVAEPPRFVPGVRTLWSQAAYRNLILSACLFAFIGMTLGAWMPSFLARSYGMSVSSVGPLLGLVVLVAGPASTIVGGVLGDRLGRRGERWSLLLPIAGGVLGLPLMCGAILSTNLPATLTLYGLGVTAIGLHIGPIFGLVQNVAPPRLRGLATAFLSMFSNLIAVGMGPLVVGAMSDALQPEFGEEALRVSMALSTLVFVPAVVFSLLAFRTLRRSSATSQPAM